MPKFKKVLVAGASGFVGVPLVKHLREDGYRVVTLVRRTPKNEQEIYWDPYKGEIDLKSLDSFNIVVNLGGENIADKRWSVARKDALVKSRVITTKFLVSALAKLHEKPEVLISASGVGFYGDRGVEILTEESDVGNGFLSDLATKWESEANKAIPFCRVVLLRIGMVLSQDGGALKKMLFPFKLGVGGKLGPGAQYMSWIHLRDLISVIKFTIENHQINGPVNAVAPESVTNNQFTQALSSILKRPAIFQVPAFALKLTLGDMASELLLASTRVVPRKLQKNGFRFQFEKLSEAFKEELIN